MRDVTRHVVTAFINGRRASRGNTSTDGRRMYLHGNLIAERLADGSIWGTLAGWSTATTRERLNGLCLLLHSPVRFYQRDYVQNVNAWHGGAVPIAYDDWIKLVS